MPRSPLVLPLAPVLVLLAFPAAAQRWEVAHDMVPRRAQDSRAVVLVDVDGDGDLDAALATLGGTLLYENDGTAVLARLALPGAESTTGLDAGDVDGDGDPDLLVARHGGAELLVNDGDGGLAVAAGALPPSTLSAFAVLVDVDGDGDLDALGRYGFSQIALLLGAGDGTFADGTAGVPTIPVFDEVVDAPAGDLDGDGDVDAYVAAVDDQDVLLLGDGAGGFVVAPEGALPPWIDDSADAALADVDADGDLDVLVASKYEEYRLLANDGSAAFVDLPLPPPTGSGFTYAVAAGDLDADGDLDLVWGRSSADVLHLGDGGGGFVDASAALPGDARVTRALAFGDLDGDLDPDVLAANGEADGLWLNDGAATFVGDEPGIAWVPYGRSAAALDADGDGDLDVALGGIGVHLLTNDGTGFLREGAPVATTAEGAVEALAAGDLDGDGDVDLWAGTQGFCDPLDVVLDGDGAGGFAEDPGALPAVPSSTWDVALTDVDGDGDLDAATAVDTGCFGGSNRNHLFLGAGDGTFADATGLLPEHMDGSRAVVAADLDGDGDVDLLVGNGDPLASVGPQQNRLLAGGGGGPFVDATAALPSVLDNTTALACGDVDADGDLDVLVGNSGFVAGANLVRLLENVGAGFADASAALPSTRTDTTAVALADVDEDGDPDALLVGSGQDEAWTNDGAGAFALAADALEAEGEFGRDLVVADLDADGDVDVVRASYARLDVDVTRQLSWRGLPRLGKPLELEVRGAPGGAWLLGFALGTAETAVAGFGTLLLDPATLTIAGAGALDADGRAVASLAVPDAPALLDATVHWQALVGQAGGALRLTNREATTGTGF